jgi:hypothetical protein
VMRSSRLPALNSSGGPRFAFAVEEFDLHGGGVVGTASAART